MPHKAFKSLIFFSGADSYHLIISTNRRTRSRQPSVAPGVDLSRISAASSAPLGHFPFKSDRAFLTQCCLSAVLISKSIDVFNELLLRFSRLRRDCPVPH